MKRLPDDALYRLLGENFKVSKNKSNLHSPSVLKNSKLDKKSFIKMVSILEDLEQTNSDLFDAGIDISMFEARFFELLDILLAKFLTKTQLVYLQVYLYGDEFIGDVPVLTNDKGEKLNPETPEELWSVLNRLKYE